MQAYYGIYSSPDSEGGAELEFTRARNIVRSSMTTPKKDREHLRRDISRSEERSPLFWFLLENYDWIIELANGRRLPWKQLCVRFEEMGLTNRLGKSVGPLTAKSTWQRVRKEVERMAARAAAAEAEHMTKGLSEINRIFF